MTTDIKSKVGILIHDPVYSPEQIRANLVMIFEAAGLSPTFENFGGVAERLSKLAGMKTPWSAKYVHSVYKGYKGCLASPAFGRAVMALAEEIDNVPSGIAGAEVVKIYAYPGQVPDGTLLPRSGKVISCARPGCMVKFIQVHPFQKYHDSDCQQGWRKAQRKAKKK